MHFFFSLTQHIITEPLPWARHCGESWEGSTFKLLTTCVSQGKHRNKYTEVNALYNLISEMAHCHFCHSLSVTQTNSGPRWERISPDVSIWRRETLAAMLEAGHNTRFFQNISTQEAKRNGKPHTSNHCSCSQNSLI